MATFKLTMKFVHGSAVSSPNAPIHRTGGFSESWYRDGSSVSDILNAFLGTTGFLQIAPLALGTARAGLLPLGSSISQVRIQSVVPLGPAQSIAVNLPGNPVKAADIPQMALLCAVPGLGANNIRRFTLRAIPDIEIVEGEFVTDPVFQGALNLFGASLAGWKFRGRDLTQPVNKVVSISAAGLVNCEAAVNYNLLDFVRVLRSQDSTKRLRGGRFQVTAVGPNNNQFTITGWTFGATTGGSVRKDGIVFPVCDAANFAVGRAVTRRVGRPFVAYRGRRSPKR